MPNRDEEVTTRTPNIRRFGMSIDIDLDIFNSMHDEQKHHAIEMQAELLKEDIVKELTKELIK